MINIRYSTGTSELWNVYIEGNHSTCTTTTTRRIFNKTAKIDTSAIGFKTANSLTTQTSSGSGRYGFTTTPVVKFRSPKWYNNSLAGYDVTNGFYVVMNGNPYNAHLTLLIDDTYGSSYNWKQQYVNEQGETITTDDHTVQSNVFKIVPNFSYGTSKTNIKSVGIKIDDINTANRNVAFSCFIVGGELLEITDVLNSTLIEEMNILSDDLPINEFDFSLISDKDLYAGNKLSVYSNDIYFGTYFVDEVNKTAQDYSATNKVYELMCVNAIGLLDKTVFEDCEFSYWNGGFVGEDTLSTAIANTSGLSFGIERSSASTNYGIVGLVPVQSLRYAVCAFSWGIRKWICTARRDDIYLRSIPSSYSLTIPDKQIIGSAIFKREKPVTSAIWEHPTENANFSAQVSTTSVVNLPAGTNQKVYYDNAPAFADDVDDTTKFSNATFKANYFTYSTSANRDNLKVITFPNRRKTVNITGVKSTQSNILTFNKFNVIGITNWLRRSPSEVSAHVGGTYSGFDNYIWGLFKSDSTWTQINNDNVVNAKSTDIEKYIKSEGKIVATIILNNTPGYQLANLTVGDMVRIKTAYDGYKIGIITKMTIRFGYNNTANIEIRESSAFLSN